MTSPPGHANPREGAPRAALGSPSADATRRAPTTRAPAVANAATSFTLPYDALPQGVNLAALDWLATLVATVGADGRVLHLNAALEDALAHPRRAVEGTPLAQWWVNSADWAAALARAQQHESEGQRFEAQLLRSNAQPLPVHVVLSHAQGGPPELGEFIVEMLPSEQQAQQAREERLLEQARGNKELIRNLAHEIKNPLGGIRGAAQLLGMEIEGRPDLIDYTQVIIREADRLQTLVDRLLAPHRRAPEWGDVNIHEVCERVRSLVLAEFGQGLTVVRDYDASIPEFRGDREALIQAVLNLAHNASQVMLPQMREGRAAQLILRTRVARQVTLGKQRHKLALQLHVIDNGPGVPEAIQDHLFMPLVSGREGGTGLGLTLAQTIVQQHHGLIACDSRPGHTDFCLTLPLP